MGLRLPTSPRQEDNAHESTPRRHLGGQKSGFQRSSILHSGSNQHYIGIPTSNSRLFDRAKIVSHDAHEGTLIDYGHCGTDSDDSVPGR